MVLGKGQHSRLNMHDGQELVNHRREMASEQGRRRKHMEKAQALSLVAAAHRLSWTTPSFVALKERMLRGGHESLR